MYEHVYIYIAYIATLNFVFQKYYRPLKVLKYTYLNDLCNDKPLFK